MLWLNQQVAYSRFADWAACAMASDKGMQIHPRWFFG
jgi:hypothetical protein